MAKKRKSPSTSIPHSIPHSKRPRHDLHSPNDDADADPSPNGLQPRLDPTYGQRGAFPGLDGDGAEAGLFYGPAQDGLEYLRMVRSEARSVPNLLVAPKLDAAAATGADTGLFEAYYHDGAYTAAPLASAAQNHDVVHHDDYDPDPQDAYYASLRARFLALRSHLHSPPLVGPPPSRPLSQASSHARWRYAILRTRPTMGLLGGMRQETVVRGLRVLESVVTVGNLRGGGVGAWAWGLLGRCRGGGEMGCEDVGVLRGVGKRAGWVLRGLRTGRGGVGVVVDRGGGGGVDGGGDAEGEGDGEVDWDAGMEEREGGGEDGGGGEEAGNGEGAGGVRLDDEQLGDSEDKTENSSTANATEPWPGSDAALAHAKHSLLSSIQRPSSPSRNSSEESSPHFAQTEGGLSDHDGEVSHAAHISEDKPEATLSAHAQSAQRDELDVYATLDMIITVVGEFYGQRDLLEERDLWDEAFEGGGLE